MTRPTGPTGPPQSTTGATGRAPGSRPWLWLVPALTFVVGLVLGGVVVAAGDSGTDDADIATRPTATAAPSAAGGPTERTITVPASCEQGLERARTALSTVDDAVDAARNLNTGRLQELLDRLQDAQQDVDRLADQCRREAPDRN